MVQNFGFDTRKRGPPEDLNVSDFLFPANVEDLA